MRTYPLAYCPPGRGFVGYLYPRALPPVTHGSALQAPERSWGTDDVIALQAEAVVALSVSEGVAPGHLILIY